jgi:Tfp pilus assembly protein PilP
MTSTRLACVVLVTILGSAPAADAEQTKPAPAKPAPAPAPAPPAQPLPTIDPGYVYEPAGRRDPFISLVGRGQQTQPAAARPPGVPGLLIGEITVKGVLKDRSGFFAMLQAPDNKTYTVRVGDKLLDGTVKSINQERVIFSQDVNDPLSLVKQREVPKPVRQSEGRG